MVSAISKGAVDTALEEVTTQLSAMEILKTAARPVIYYAALVAGQDGIDAAESDALFAIANSLNVSKGDADNLIRVSTEEVTLLAEISVSREADDGFSDN